MGKIKVSSPEATMEKPQSSPKEKKAGYIKKNAEPKHVFSKKYLENKLMVDKNKVYSLNEGLDMLLGMKKAKFDESVELHLNTTDKGISGNMILPHGTGKQTRVAILAPMKDATAADALLAEIAEGTINFDILVATPDAMPKLAKVARILGPRGLMPNPKNGTVTTKPEEVANKFAGGQVNFKTEAKFPILHMSVGKISFGKEKLSENIEAAVVAIQAKNIKKATITSTMGAGIRIQLA